MVKALADRLAEALAEWLHQQARARLGLRRGGGSAIEDLIRENYRGIRPAPGYPACPDHTEKRLLFDLLGGEARAGIRLTETLRDAARRRRCAASTSRTRRRATSRSGKIERDQVLDYHRRKGMDLRAVERWLAPNLGYDPATDPASPSRQGGRSMRSPADGCAQLVGDLLGRAPARAAEPTGSPRSRSAGA